MTFFHFLKGFSKSFAVESVKDLYRMSKSEEPHSSTLSKPSSAKPGKSEGPSSSQKPSKPNEKPTGTKGTGQAKYSTNNLPKDPKELINNGWKDTTPEGMMKNTSSREYIDPATGMKIRFDPEKPGANGFEGKDHYHIHNPNSTGKNDYYLDVSGNPVAKGSKASHIIP
ncbi:hypothetical protein HPL003_08520 [Paenibacillus terrae HPL-003]|uniref:HNH/Endo VII superfamily nuclease toxins domain-containing protein n=1 Tax=Paenibacillus terrae (strain HPL-003) TaxID=985665 RepID=G7VYD9_PAETH|nr:hypothetical protein [Paenibacillus terrae]AET58467.1 hypothetical protein HPL003_08520 [Paenibacillus terrae HPL-003]